MRYRYLRFPGGKFKAVTLSYDDGVKQDIRFAEILDKYGIKCTFNINSNSLYSNSESKITAQEMKTHLYDKGHEIAVHGKHHVALGNPSPSLGIRDVLDCRQELEDALDTIIRGMAYPDTGIRTICNGNSYDNIRHYLKDLGIVYARTLGGDNDAFQLPSDFYAWMPTAHHNNKNLIPWAENFVALEECTYAANAVARLFYLWGHSYEFDRNDNWDVIENFCQTIGGKDDIWYATNIEIYEYIEAYNSLIFSADCKKIYNPTLKEIWIYIDREIYSIKPGETLKI